MASGDTKPTLCYWNIRGLAQPIRILLKYKEVDFVDKRLNYGPLPFYSRSEWFEERECVELDFPNLPYYIDGAYRFTQSTAIMRYLARKYGLAPTQEIELQRADIIEQQITDLRNGLTKIAYDNMFELLKKDYLKNLDDKLKLLSKYLDKRRWFASDENIFYVDFMVYEVLHHHRILEPFCLHGWRNLKDYMKRFEELPTIKSYMESDEYLKWPLNGDHADFGSRRTAITG